jgi:hypothetical protein
MMDQNQIDRFAYDHAKWVKDLYNAEEMPSAGNPEGIKTKGKWKKENTEELVFPSYTKWLERKAVPVYYPNLA